MKRQSYISGAPIVNEIIQFTTLAFSDEGRLNMNGIIPLWKPKGMTSHDCVAIIRKLFKTKKVGHTGTLDPAVEGVLIICINQATRLVSIFQEESKEYVAELSLGKSTTTEDQTGEIVKSKSVSNELTLNEIDAVIQSFIGEIVQVPPMYSAIRVDGKRLYEYAREGIAVNRPERTVTINHIKRLSSELNRIADDDVRFHININCSSGTYIRTLCVDIGEQLGYPAHMSYLERTKQGYFNKDETVTLDEVREKVEAGQESDVLLSIDDALRNIDSLIIDDEVTYQFKHGQVLDIPLNLKGKSLFKIYTKNGQLIALYEQHPTKQNKMKPFTVFN